VSLDDFPLLRTSYDLNAAVEAWGEVTGYEPGERGDAVLADCLVHLRDAGLMYDASHHIARAVLALLTGAILHRHADLTLLSERGQELHLIESTRRAAEVVANLGTPTGYEHEPEQLARLIHDGTPLGAM
jgi:hypothetical protein